MRLIVERLGYYEKFEEDVRQILGAVLSIGDVPHLLRNDNRRHYRDYYTADLADRVRKLYAQDVEMFDYSY